MVLVGVAYQDRPSAALAFMRDLGGDWPLVSDPSSRTALAFGVVGVPETYVIDRRGDIAFKSTGPVTYSALTDEIAAVLNGRSA